MLRLASSDLFAEHAAPGLISLFTQPRARPRRRAERAPRLGVPRPARLAHGGRRARARSEGSPPGQWCSSRSSPTTSSWSRRRSTRRPQARSRSTSSPSQTWHLGPGASGPAGEASGCCVASLSPRASNASSRATPLPWPRPGAGWACRSRWDSPSATTSATAGSCGSTPHSWSAVARGRRGHCPRSSQPSASAELIRFVATPRATQAMVRGEAAGVGRFRPAVHVTLWS